MLTHVDNRITYSGNGNATEFAYQFKILDRTDIKVLLTDADGKEKLLTKDYYVDVEKNVVRYPGYAVGAEVPESERPPVLPTGWKLTIYREVPVTQETDLPDQYPFNQVEAIGDKLTMIAQQLTDAASRSLKVNISKSADVDTTIPWVNGKSFRISDDGTKVELTEDPAKVLPTAQSLAAAAAKSESNAKAYMDTTKDLSENVNVFVPSVDADGTLTWTNKAGLANPAAVNVKGAKGDTGLQGVQGEKGERGPQGATGPQGAKGDKGDKGDTGSQGIQGVKGDKGDTGEQGLQGIAGTAATIHIGSVYTGEPGTNASVTNSGTSTNAILNFTIPRGQPGAGGGTSVEVDAALSATSLNPVQNKVIKAALDNKVNKTDTIYEANLGWGGRNIVDGYSPIDAAMVPFLGANRFAFAHAEGITVEYSTDAGKTWLDYGLSNNEKIGLLLSPKKQINIGKAPDNPLTPASMLRVTLNTTKIGLYTNLNKFIMQIATNGCKDCYCTIDASLKSTPETFKVFADKARLSGWSGWNVINTQNIATYSNAPNIQYNTIRFTFGCTEVNTNFKGLGVYCIFGFGGVGWNTPSNMAQNGHLYNYNALQEATFPANVSAPAFIGNLTGTADKAKSDGEGNVITETYAKKADVSGVVKSVNDTKPDASGNVTIAVSGGGVSTSESNTWSAQQNFHDLMLNREKYTTYVINGTSDTPITSTVVYAVTGAFTLDLATLAGALSASQSSVFTAYFAANADYSLTISNAGNLKYVGSASDVAITSAGLLLNIWMSKDGGGTLTSIVQASKLS